MSTEIQILLWSVLFLVIRAICIGLNIRPINAEEKVKVKKTMMWINLARLVCLWIVILFASPYHDWAVDHIGTFISIVAMSIIVIPKRAWRYVAIDALEA